MKLNDSDFVIRKMSKQTTLIPLQHKLKKLGCILVLNETSELIVDLLKKNKNEKEIVDKLCDVYSCSEKNLIEKDVKNVLKELKHVGFVL